MAEIEVCGLRRRLYKVLNFPVELFVILFEGVVEFFGVIEDFFRFEWFFEKGEVAFFEFPALVDDVGFEDIDGFGVEMEGIDGLMVLLVGVFLVFEFE